MIKLKREEKGFYYYENPGIKNLFGRTDWSVCFITKINGVWCMNLDKGMTKKTFKTLKEAREYLDY